MEPCQPPLFFGDREGIDLSGWNGSINAPAFRALVDATGAVSRGERPKAGVGYSTGKTRSSFSYLATIFSLFAIVSATGSIANLISLGSATEVVRDIVQSYRALTYPILEYGLGWWRIMSTNAWWTLRCRRWIARRAPPICSSSSRAPKR